jgi:hypothetical protein
MFKNKIWFLTVLAALIISGLACANPQSASQNTRVVGSTTPVPIIRNKAAASFAAEFEIKQGNLVSIDMGIVGGECLKEDLDFNGSWSLEQPERDIKYEGEFPELKDFTYCSGRLESLHYWEGFLPAGSYRLEFGAPGYGSSLYTFDVVFEGGIMKLDNRASHLSVYYPFSDDPNIPDELSSN